MNEWRDIGGGYSCDCGVKDIDRCRAGQDCTAIKGLVVLIWSDEHGAYWRQNSCGYTASWIDAGRFSAEYALKTTADLGPEKRIHIEWNAPSASVGYRNSAPQRAERSIFERWYREEYVATRSVMYPAPVRPELDGSVRQVRDHVMTPEEMFEQRVSFVYGNLAMSNPNITKEMVREVALAMLPDKRKLERTRQQ